VLWIGGGAEVGSGCPHLIFCTGSVVYFGFFTRLTLLEREFVNRLCQLPSDCTGVDCNRCSWCIEGSCTCLFQAFLLLYMYSAWNSFCLALLVTTIQQIGTISNPTISAALIG